MTEMISACRMVTVFDGTRTPGIRGRCSQADRVAGPRLPTWHQERLRLLVLQKAGPRRAVFGGRRAAVRTSPGRHAVRLHISAPHESLQEQFAHDVHPGLAQGSQQRVVQREFACGVRRRMVQR